MLTTTERLCFQSKIVEFTYSYKKQTWLYGFHLDETNLPVTRSESESSQKNFDTIKVAINNDADHTVSI